MRKIYTFKCFGHEKIICKSKMMFGFLKDSEEAQITECIVGINSDFEIENLKQFSKKIKIILAVNIAGKEIKNEFKATVNPTFEDMGELYIRKGFFPSNKNFGFNLNRGSTYIDREIVKYMKIKDSVLEITIYEGWY